MMRSRATAALVACLLLGAGLAGCTASTGEANTIASPAPNGSVDPNDVPVDDTDYSKDGGNNPQEYEYEDEEPPAESIVATLCNLNRSFFTGLRTAKGGTAVVDDTLRTNLVGLSDLLDEWVTLEAHYPDEAQRISLAQRIHDKWDAASLSAENGNTAAAAADMAAAEALIKQLPAKPGENCR